MNDGVMGGVSDGRIRFTADKHLEFFGTLSLKNNGGFASVRTKPTVLDIEADDTIVVRVKGDGRDYMLNLYTTSRRMAFSYRASLPTKKDEWTEVRVALDDFIPTAFGRRAQGMDQWSRTRSTALILAAPTGYGETTSHAESMTRPIIQSAG